jgi:hypothetical protein
MMNKIRNILDTRNKKIIALVSAVLAIGVTSISVYALTNTKKELLKLVESVSLEYGEDASDDSELYIDTTDLTKAETTEVLKNATITFTDIEIEEELTYPKIGEYTVVVTYQEETQETTLIVEDTTPPVFNEVNEVTFEQGTENFPYHEHITAEDLQKVTLEFQTESVDINKVGEYTMLVIATDASGNTAEKEIKVIVTEKQVVDEPQEQQNTETNNANSNSNNSNNNTPTGGSNNQSNSNNTPNTGGGNSNQNQGVNSGGNTAPSTPTAPPTPTPPAPPQNPYVNANLVISAPNANGQSNNFWFANGARNDAWVNNYILSNENINGHGYIRFGVVSNGFGGWIYNLYV